MNQIVTSACARVVALVMGAVTEGRAISHAMALAVYIFSIGLKFNIETFNFKIGLCSTVKFTDFAI